MRIGIDFDNTIVCYDALFHQLAYEKDLIPHELAINKTIVRDFLRLNKSEDHWTTMQGEVYGLRMDEAKPYPYAIESIALLKHAGHEIYIVSHKTKHPFMGPAYDLHFAADRWISANLNSQGVRLIEKECVFYELSKEEKIHRIKHLNCDVFIDDLPEILTLNGYPEHTKKILFDPENQHNWHNQSFQIANSWLNIYELLSN